MLERGVPLEDFVQKEVALREKEGIAILLFEAYSKGPEGWKEYGAGWEPTSWDGRLLSSPRYAPSFGYERQPSRYLGRDKKSDLERAVVARSVTRLCDRGLMVRLWINGNPWWLITSDGIEVAKWLEWDR